MHLSSVNAPACGNVVAAVLDNLETENDKYCSRSVIDVTCVFRAVRQFVTSRQCRRSSPASCRSWSRCPLYASQLYASHWAVVSRQNFTTKGEQHLHVAVATAL